MHAVVLVGGFGTRLRPLTDTIPKPMLPVGNVPLIARHIAGLARGGVDEVTLALGFRPEPFLAAFPEQRCGGVLLHYAVEPEPLDTAGAIRFAAEQTGIDSTFVVANGDVLTDLDVAELVTEHRTSGAAATIHLIGVDDPSAFGVAELGEGGRIVRFVEKPAPGTAPSNLINAGTYVLEPSVLGLIPPGRRVSVERETFPMLVEQGTVRGLARDVYWLDAGRPELYIQANLDLLDGRRRERAAPVAADALVASDAVIDRSVIGSGAVVGARSLVRASVILPGASIGADVTVRDSVVMGTVGDGAELAGALIGAGAAVAAGAVVTDARVPDPSAPPDDAPRIDEAATTAAESVGAAAAAEPVAADPVGATEPVGVDVDPAAGDSVEGDVDPAMAEPAALEVDERRPVLVIGGAGFIGSHLVDRLLADGLVVDVVDDLSTGSLASLADARAVAGAGQLHIQTMDAGTPELAELIALRRPTTIHHLALLGGHEQSAQDHGRRFTSMLGVLEAARTAGVQKVVVALPATAIYGHPSGRELPVKEGALVARGVRGVVAKAIVDLLTTYRERYDVEFTALAVATVYGPRQRPAGGVVAAAVAAAAGGTGFTLSGDGRQTRDFVYVDDVVDALARAGQRGSGLVVNVGTGLQTSLRDLWSQVAPGAAAAATTPARPDELGRFAVSPVRARIHLGWSPWTPLSEGLAALRP